MRKQRLGSTCKTERKPKGNQGSLLLSRQLSIAPGHPQVLRMLCRPPGTGAIIELSGGVVYGSPSQYSLSRFLRYRKLDPGAGSGSGTSTGCCIGPAAFGNSATKSAPHPCQCSAHVKGDPLPDHPGFRNAAGVLADRISHGEQGIDSPQRHHHAQRTRSATVNSIVGTFD